MIDAFEAEVAGGGADVEAAGFAGEGLELGFVEAGLDDFALVVFDEAFGGLDEFALLGADADGEDADVGGGEGVEEGGGVAGVAFAVGDEDDDVVGLGFLGLVEAGEGAV